MASIDQVISRSRQPGGFSEKKRFSVARQRGIRKMREFALADPHYYVLELIQAAVANGAENVDIRAEKREFGLSYIGGGFTQEELAQLFDFLFASKKDFEHGDIRQLALGVNALMIFEPDSIIVESGDGTLEGTTRIEIRGRDETVDVGTPDQALRGTFISATGLDRSAVKGKSNLGDTDYGPPETRAIEERCLAAPVPIIVNTEPVFGYATVRTPSVFGYDDVVGFDEGDLYGTIGQAVHAHKRFFKVMTWGVWISSLEHDLLERGQIGGVVNFDRLNKTADHSGIVQDEALEELWARLLPYARRSQQGETGKVVFQIRPLGGERLHPKALRDLVREAGSVIAMPEDLEPGTEKAVRATELGGLLDAPVLCVADADFEALENLAGPRVRILRPEFDDQSELAFFRKPVADPPPRPWLCGAMDVEPMNVAGLREALYAEEHTDDFDQFEAFLDEVIGRSGSVSCRIFTPDNDDIGRTDLWVRVLAMDRLVWEGPVPSTFPGHVVDIEVPAIAPIGLLDQLPGNTDLSLAEAIAQVVARHLIDDLSTTASRAIRALSRADVRPGSIAARISLAAIARNALLRLREPDGEQQKPGLFVSMLEQPSEIDLLELPLFETLSGEILSVSDLPEIMGAQRGLLYGVVPDVEPDLRGLDRTKILSLDRESERLLRNIVGPASYVRVDRRDLLASVDGLTVRDIAAGLREDGGQPLLLESDARVDADGIPESTIRLLVSGLTRVALTRPFDSEHARRLRLQRLTGDVLDLDPHAEPPDGATDHPRQALMHLQYFLFRRWQHNRTHDEALPTYGLERMPLFVGDRGELVSLEAVDAALGRQGKLVMLDGRGIDAFVFGRDIGTVGDDRGECSGLAMNPWLLDLFSEVADFEPAFDFDLTDDEAQAYAQTPDQAYLFESMLDAPGITGKIGVAPQKTPQQMVAVVEPGHSQVHPLRQYSEEFGVVGFVRVEEGSASARWDDVNGVVDGASRRVLREMIDALPSTEPGSDKYARMLEVLFDHASRHVEFERLPNGRVESRVDRPLAEMILDIPLFPTTHGTPVSAQRLIHEFCLEQTKGAPVGGPAIIQDAVSPRLQSWIERTLRPERITERPHTSADEEEAFEIPDKPASEMTEPELTRLLGLWLQRLRPDEYGRMKRGSSEDATPLGLHIELVNPTERESILGLSSNEAKRLAQGMEADAPFAYTVASEAILLINRQHWVWREFREGSRPEPQRLAWMLLSIYAFINEVLEPVTNDHEIFFQQRIAEALLNGDLGTSSLR